VAPPTSTHRLTEETVCPTARFTRAMHNDPSISISVQRLLCSRQAIAVALICSSLLVKSPAQILSAADGSNAAEALAKQEAVYRSKIVPLLKKHCLECHGPDAQEAEVAFHIYKSAAAVAADAKVWERTLDMLESQAMPPDDQPALSEADRKTLVDWIEQTIYYVDCTTAPDPGRVTIRRLNRAEYNNTVRDLLEVEFKPADDFPSDDVGSGFDNIADVLSLPPLLMEKYLAAAEKIAGQAIVADPATLAKVQRKDKDLLTEGSAQFQKDHYALISRGAIAGEFEVPRPGMYIVRAQASQSPAGNDPARMELRLGTKRTKTFDVTAHRSEPATYEFRVKLPAGKHQVVAEFLNDFYDKDAKDPKKRDRNLYVNYLEVVGPTDLGPNDYPAMHRKLVAVRPSGAMGVKDAAKRNLRPLVNRAFRRKATEDEVDRLAGLVEEAVQQGDSFEQGMQVALIGVLVSPQFLFRIEADPKSGVRELGDYELAARLSYFLWSSLPDNELFAVATEGKLNNDEMLQKQIRRMLKDRKADALVENFAAQWLNLRLLDGITPDPEKFGQFNDELRSDMRKETEQFFAHIMREDRSLLDFLEADYTFVNERLSKHYGLEGVSGDEFRRVELKGRPRVGVLTQASILTLTSNAARTSPVKRGKWILDNLLGSPPPDPPPDVPELDAVRKAMPNASLRKQLEIHRENAVCASCHKTMDPLGFGLENYDAIGRWRDKDGGQPIDASGVLPGGDKFNGSTELVKVLSKRREDFARCLAEKMFTYALGRELTPADRCHVDKVVAGVDKENYRFSALVTEIVKSEPFRKRRAEGTQ